MVLSKKTVWAVSVLGCAALLIFFFLDLPAAQSVYRPGTWFGAFFRVAAPMMPPVFGLLFSGCLARSESEPAGWRFFGCFTALLFASAGGYLFFHYLGRSHPAAVAALSLLLLSGSLLLGGVLHPRPETLRRTAVTAVIVIAAVFLTVELLKNIWGRQRFCFMADPAAEFTRWLFPQGRPSSDAFKSFPSGHTANGSMVLLLLLLPSVFPGAERHRLLLKLFAGGWIVLTALSRMLEGMHFASDVTAGFLVAFWVFCAVSGAAQQRRPKGKPERKEVPRCGNAGQN